MSTDRVFLAVVTPIGVALLYFLLAGEVSLDEAIGCAITLVIACPYAVATARSGTVPMRLTARGLWAIAASFGSLLPQSVRVGRALLRGEGQGAVISVPFRFGALDAGDVGRRAAVGVALSLAPNGFVVGMDHQTDELIVHQLAEETVGGDREWPG